MHAFQFAGVMATPVAEAHFNWLWAQHDCRNMRWSSISPANLERQFQAISAILSVPELSIHISTSLRMKYTSSGYLGREHQRYNRIMLQFLVPVLNEGPPLPVVLDISNVKRALRLERALKWFERQWERPPITIQRINGSEAPLSQLAMFLASAFAYGAHDVAGSAAKLTFLSRLLNLLLTPSPRRPVVNVPEEHLRDQLVEVNRAMKSLQPAAPPSITVKPRKRLSLAKVPVVS